LILSSSVKAGINEVTRMIMKIFLEWCDSVAIAALGEIILIDIEHFFFHIVAQQCWY